MLCLQKDLHGKILDVGGGGEGIIGRLYQNQVTAIDNRQDELDEAPDGFEKVLMDATDMAFPDASFDHVTFFYTLMYLRGEEQRRAILEAARVLRCGGALHIWDCEILSAYPDPFLIDVEIQLPNDIISTTYGVGKLDAQDKDSIMQLCLDAGLRAVSQASNDCGFYLHFQKDGHESAPSV